MMKPLFLVLAIIAFILPISAQQIKGEWTPASWHEFTLGKTSPKEAVKNFGRPYFDQIGSLSARLFSTWLSDKAKKKIFRGLAWENKASTKVIDMCFENNKLVFIIVVLKTDFNADWFSPDKLDETFGEKFVPFITNNKNFMPFAEFQKFAGEPRENLVKKTYEMGAFSEKSFIFASVSDQELSREQEAKSASQNFPGRVVSVALVSRTIEAK